MFGELRRLIHTGRAGDSPLVLEQQLAEAFERIAAKYGGEASFQAYIAYFRATYMKRKRTYTATALCRHELC